jgi:hypothetical protein
VSPAPNWAVVPGQRRPENNSRDWSCHGPALKSNVLNCGNALVWGWGHVPELRADLGGDLGCGDGVVAQGVGDESETFWGRQS